jgi:hypothetical protein
MCKVSPDANNTKFQDRIVQFRLVQLFSRRLLIGMLRSVSKKCLLFTKTGKLTTGFAASPRKRHPTEAVSTFVCVHSTAAGVEMIEGPAMV